MTIHLRIVMSAGPKLNSRPCPANGSGLWPARHTLRPAPLAGDDLLFDAIVPEQILSRVAGVDQRIATAMAGLQTSAHGDPEAQHAGYPVALAVEDGLLLGYGAQ